MHSWTSCFSNNYALGNKITPTAPRERAVSCEICRYYSPIVFVIVIYISKPYGREFALKLRGYQFKTGYFLIFYFWKNEELLLEFWYRTIHWGRWIFREKFPREWHFRHDLKTSLRNFPEDFQRGSNCLGVIFQMNGWVAFYIRRALLWRNFCGRGNITWRETWFSVIIWKTIKN
jgi:hypothetical protein